MKTLNNEDIKNILALINLAPVKGSDAMTVALLQQKLSGMMIEDLPAPTTASSETKKK